jgi:hypothetical protein
MKVRKLKEKQQKKENLPSQQMVYNIFHPYTLPVFGRFGYPFMNISNGINRLAMERFNKFRVLKGMNFNWKNNAVKPNIINNAKYRNKYKPIKSHVQPQLKEKDVSFE